MRIGKHARAIVGLGSHTCTHPIDCDVTWFDTSTKSESEGAEMYYLSAF